MTTATTSFYVTGGTLRSDAPSYVERQADRDLYEGLSRGEFCYVLHARQMGKSSLMVRTAARLREEGVAVVILDLTKVGQNLSAEQWYDGLLYHLGEQLDLEAELDDFWRDHPRLGPLQRWMAALRQVVLARVPGRLVLFVDEIDTVRSLPFSTDEFFAGIRACYNERTEDPEYLRLTFCLLGVASPSDLIRDTRLTPFNIGRRIELTDFTEAEAAPLAAGLVPAIIHEDHEAARREVGGAVSHPALSRASLQRVLYWTGGHPYLTQRLCQAIASAPRPKSKTQDPEAEVDRHCEALFLSASAREKDDNLLFVRERLLRSEADLASLLDLYATVWRGQRVGVDDSNPLIDLLRLSGVARLAGGRLVVRNRIYARVFDRAWVTTHMPDAERRRQRAAYRRGLWRAAGVSAAVLAVVGSLAVTAMDEARRAEQQRRLAEQGQRALRRTLYAARLNLAQQAEEADNLPRAQELLDAVRPEPGQEDLRGFEWRYLWRRCQGNALATLWRGSGYVNAVAFSPDGKLLATSSFYRGVHLWDVARRREIGLLMAGKGPVNALAFSPDGKTLVTGGDDPLVRLWDVASRRQIAALQGNVQQLAFSPDGRLLASASAFDHTVRLWALEEPSAISHQPSVAGTDGRQPAAISHQPGAWRTIAMIKDYLALPWLLPSLAFSPDGRLLAFTSRDGPLQLWDVAGYRSTPETWSRTTPRLVATLGEKRVKVVCAAFSPDGKTLATGSDDDSNSIRLWNLASKREVGSLRGESGVIVAFSPDGKTLASARGDGTLKLWDLATRQELATFRGHQGIVNPVAFSPDGKLLASGGSKDGTVKLWDAATRAATTDVIRQKAAVGTLAFSPDGRVLATGSADGIVKLWDATTRRPLAALRGHKRAVRYLMFSPDRNLLASGSEDHTLKLWDVRTRRAIVTLPGFVCSSRSLTFAPDSRTLAFQGQTAVKLWDVRAKRVVATFPWHKGPPWDPTFLCVGFSPDGRTLAINSNWENTLWDVATHRATGTFPAMGNFVFSPDGKLLAEREGGDQVKLWDLASRHEVTTLHLSNAIASASDAIALSPDGRTLAVGSDHSVTLLNLATRQEVAVLKSHTRPVTGVAFSPDGNTLASSGADGTVRLWRAASFLEADPLAAVASGGDRAVLLQWRPLPHAQGYNIYRGQEASFPGRFVKANPEPVVSGSFVDHDPGLVDGKAQVYTVSAIYAGGAGKTVEGPRVLLRATPVAAPPGLWGCSIGGSNDESPPSGSALFDPGTGEITIRGSGDDIFGAADQFYFLHQLVAGNFQVTVQALTPPTRTDEWAKAALMIRESLDPGARDAYLVTTAAHGLQVQWRATTHGAAVSQDVIPPAAFKMPILLRLTRQEDTVIPTYSTDGGQHFRPAGPPLSFDEPLPRTIYAGLAITAHNHAKISEARFDDLRVEALRR